MNRFRLEKHYIIIILFSIIILSCSKTNYTGSYTKDLGNNYFEYLVLRQDSTFEYRSNEYSNTTKPYMPVMTGPLDSIGMGRYEIRKKKLYLDYGIDYRQNVFVEPLNPSNSNNLEFHMMDIADSLGLPFVNISYLKLPKGYLEGVNSDFDGKAKMKVSPSDFPLELDFKFIGYAPEKVYLKEVGYYKISIYFHEAPKKLQGKRVYPISKFKDTIDINGLQKTPYPKVKSKKK